MPSAADLHALVFCGWVELIISNICFYIVHLHTIRPNSHSEISPAIADDYSSLARCHAPASSHLPCLCTPSCNDFCYLFYGCCIFREVVGEFVTIFSGIFRRFIYGQVLGFGGFGLGSQRGCNCLRD